MVKERIKQLLQRRDFGASVKVQGWVRTRRDSKGGFSFIEVNDGSTVKGIQVIAPADLPNYASEIAQLSPGACVEIEGALSESPAQGQAVEVKASRVTVIGGSDPEEYPLQKKRHSFEFLRTIAHLRPRSNTFGAVARVRNRLSYAIHNFFQERGFVYVHTPIITASDCEGAGELFTVTTLDPAKPPKNDKGEIDWSADFFGRRAFLTVSGQLEGEIYATALTDIYTFGPTFRAENSNTPRHLAEFWMIEPEMCFCDLDGDAAVAEEFVRYVLKDALEHCGEELEFFNQFVDETHTLLKTLQHVAETPFERVTYTDAIDILHKSGEKFEFPVEWGRDLQTEHERFLAEKHFKKPVIVTNYPRTLKPFYMRVDDNGKTVSAMDILAPKIGEIVGGSQREERLDLLDLRMRECHLDPASQWWYRDLRRFGTVPHAGFGLGFERLVQFVTGMSNIRDVIPFPRTPKSAEF
jgi:asparaginyl-tRNA synthetase